MPEPLALGLDRYTMQTFGNKDFLVNCINYLVNDNGLIEMRSREIKPRLLDQARIKESAHPLAACQYRYPGDY